MTDLKLSKHVPPIDFQVMRLKVKLFFACQLTNLPLIDIASQGLYMFLKYFLWINEVDTGNEIKCLLFCN